MREKLFNFAFYALIAIVFAIFVYSAYQALFSDTREIAKRAIANQVHQCQRIQGRSAIVENFMLEAAAARRFSAQKSADSGDEITAQNELATAMKYETFARQHDALVVKDCQTEYADR
jgi:hypothetical protein